MYSTGRGPLSWAVVVLEKALDFVGAAVFPTVLGKVEQENEVRRKKVRCRILGCADFCRRFLGKYSASAESTNRCPPVLPLSVRHRDGEEGVRMHTGVGFA